jgi:hypothetical protein
MNAVDMLPVEPAKEAGEFDSDLSNPAITRLKNANKFLIQAAAADLTLFSDPYWQQALECVTALIQKLKQHEKAKAKAKKAAAYEKKAQRKKVSRESVEPAETSGTVQS